jgi:hypothetical protein
MNHEQDPQEDPTADPRQRIARARADFLAALRNTFDSPDGQHILRWLHTTAGTAKPAFLPSANGAPLCPLAAALRDGRRSIVHEIEANLQKARAEHGASPTPAAPKTRARRSSRLQGS